MAMPGSAWCSSRAMPTPNTVWNTIDRKVQTVACRNESQNSGSRKMNSKLASPTKALRSGRSGL